MKKNSLANGSNSTSPKYEVEQGILFKISEYKSKRIAFADDLTKLVERHDAPRIRIVFSRNKDNDWAIVSLAVPNEYEKKVLNDIKRLAKKYSSTTYDSHLCCVEYIDI